MRYMVRRPESMIDRFFNDFYEGDRSLGNHIDILKEGNEYIINLEMPGFEKDEIAIDFQDDILSIDATHKEETQEDENKEYVYRSRSFRNVSRKIRFNEIDVDNIQASYDNGVLKIVLPRMAEEEPVSKRIELK